MYGTDMEDDNSMASEEKKYTLELWLRDWRYFTTCFC
jgi:hypothetical protein